jgi:hypothetical protein
MTNRRANFRWARRCQLTLQHYNDERDTKANLIDLLADARHWCDRNGLNFAELDRVAYQHYAAEAFDARRK